jgi:hypothetical protein
VASCYGSFQNKRVTLQGTGNGQKTLDRFKILRGKKWKVLALKQSLQASLGVRSFYVFNISGLKLKHNFG